MEEFTGPDIALGVDGHVEIALGPGPAQLLQPFGHAGAGVLIIAVLVDAALGQHEHQDARQNDEAEVDVILPRVQLPCGKTVSGEPVAKEFIHTLPPYAEHVSLSAMYQNNTFPAKKKGEK